ncbi:MAG TPA: protein kinase [Halanaerobiales bacterium]|nr:protein kinase [Halanaerobiales bacterium]
MDKEYIKYEKENKEYVAESIFVSKKPRSRVMLSTVKELKPEINKHSFDNENIIDYKAVEKIDGKYYLISKEDQYYPPLIERVKKADISLKEGVRWSKQIIEIWNSNENANEFTAEIKANYFRLDENKNIKLINPFINKKIEQYRYQDLDNEFDEIYRPPEIINRENWDEKARIYNFGVILYHLSTGQFPFQGEDKKEMYDKKMTGSVIAPRFINPDISASLSDLILDMLAQNKDRRPESLEKVIDNLEKLSQNNTYQASKEERETNLNKSGSQFTKNRLKEKVVFYFRHHWGKTLFFGILIGLIFGIGMLGGNPPVITEQTTPDEVVEFFYSSIDKKDSIVIDQTTTADLGDLETMVSEGHVMETMRSAYGGLPEEEKEGTNKIFGIRDLTVNKTQRDDYYIYKASYIFFYPREKEMREKEMQDTLTVKKVKEKWQITEIKGSIVELIEGKFEG